MPLVTVAIPFHDNVATLGAAIGSVLAQSERDLELLLIDDGSSDGSREIAEKQRSERVRVIGDGRNRGLGVRLNEIAAVAGGEYLARMDADDLCHPERIVTQLRHLADHPEVDVVACGAWIIDEDDHVVGRRHCHALPVGDWVPLARGPLLHPTVMARTEWFRRHPYDPAFVRAEDKELWCRTWTTSVFAQIPEPLLFYRVAGRISSASYREGCRNDRRILARYGPRLVGRTRTAAMLAEAVAVEALTLAAERSGLGAQVLARRNRRVSAADVARAERVLAQLGQAATP